MNSNAQNNLIVTGKSQKQKRRAIVCGLPRREKTSEWPRLAGFSALRKIRIGKAALPAPMHARETSSGMIARGLSHRGFPVGLRVRHALTDALENLFFGKSGIFQAADFRAAHGALALQSPVQDQIDGGIGKPDQPQHDGIAADTIQLIRFRNFQNHRLGVTRTREVDCGIGVRKLVLALVRAGNQSYASIVTDPGLLQLYKLRDFRVRSVQRFELLDAAGPHPRLVERTIIREQVLLAPAHPEEDEHTEKHELVPHDSILSRADGAKAKCVVRDTRAKGQVGKTVQTANGEKKFSTVAILARCKL